MPGFNGGPRSKQRDNRILSAAAVIFGQGAMVNDPLSKIVDDGGSFQGKKFDWNQKLSMNTQDVHHFLRHVDLSDIVVDGTREETWIETTKGELGLGSVDAEVTDLPPPGRIQFCLQRYISYVTGFFMHGLSNNFEYPPGTEGERSKGVKCLEKARHLTQDGGSAKYVGVMREQDVKPKTIDRTLVEAYNGATIKLYQPREIGKVEELWKKFGIELSEDDLKRWKYEFHLAGYYRSIRNNDELFLPMQFITAILQLCCALHDSWMQWAKVYDQNKGEGLEPITDDVNDVIKEQKGCFMSLAKMFLLFNKKNAGHLRGIVRQELDLDFACCHCPFCTTKPDDTKQTTQNQRFRDMEEAIKNGTIDDGKADLNVNSKIQVELSLVLWLQKSMEVKTIEDLILGVLGFSPTATDTYRNAEKLACESLGEGRGSFNAEKYLELKFLGDPDDPTDITPFTFKLPRWFDVTYILGEPPSPKGSGDHVQEGKIVSYKFLLNAINDARKEKDIATKEQDWVTRTFPVNVNVSDFRPSRSG